MRIFGVSTIKNEADILLDTYPRFLEWCDEIAVLDNGSTDGSQDILKALEQKYPNRFHYIGSTKERFTDCLRRKPYMHLLPRAERGDWWCRVDPDEIFIDHPPTFLANLPFYEGVVASLHFQYYFTREELNQYDSKEEGLPIDQRRRWYAIDGASEPRLWRHYPKQKWPQNFSFPKNMGPVSKKHIRLKHFKYRSPVQMKSRLKDRTQAYNDGHKAWEYAVKDHWEDQIASKENLHYDDLSGNFQYPDPIPFLWKDSFLKYWLKAVQFFYLSRL